MIERLRRALTVWPTTVGPRIDLQWRSSERPAGPDDLDRALLR